MHLYLFLLVVVSLSCGSLPETDVSLSRAAAATAGMVVGWGILCHVCARLCALQVRKESIDPLVGADVLEKMLNAFRWLGLGVVVLCLGGFGLARCLDSIPVFQDSVFLQSLVLLTPGLCITAATWSAEHLYGVLLEYVDRSPKHYLHSMWRLFRSNVAWLIVPVVLLLAAVDVIARLPIGQDVAGWITAVMVLLFVPLGLPWMIRRLFKTGPLNEVNEKWVGELTDAAGLSRTRALRWDTGGNTFNAMVVGFVPPLRTLLISDRLIDELPRSQVAMVVLHEAAHLGRRHVPIRMLAILPAWGAGALVSRMAGEHDWALTVGSAVAILLTILILRVVAYRTEYDADVEACRMAERMSDHVAHVPSTYDDACDALASALMRVTFDQPAGRHSTWLHPGVAERVAWMRRQRKAPNNSTAAAGTVAKPA